MTQLYAPIIFVQDPEYSEAGEPICPVALWLDNAWQGDDDSLIAHLSQWDYGEYHEQNAAPGAGTSDDTFTHGEYLVTYNRRLGYVGLERIIEEE